MVNYSYVSLSRRFLEISSVAFEEDTSSIWSSFLNEKQGKPWGDILNNDVSVLLGTAGSGKTTELRQQVRSLNNEGMAAFLLRTEALQSGPFTDAFDFDLTNQAEEFKKWLRSEREGIVFLDALDEARLPSGRNESALDKALVAISNAIGRRKSAVKLLISSRPSEWRGENDLRRLKQCIRRMKKLPIPADEDDHAPLKIGIYRIAPLSSGDIEKLAQSRGADTELFINSINESLSVELLQQPLDVHFFLDAWTASIDAGRVPETIFQSRKQVMNDLVNWRIQTPKDGETRSNLDFSRAKRAAGKLAAYVLVSGIQDLVQGATENSEVNADKILSTDSEPWTPLETRQLLSCGLFHPSVGGRIRFAHRELRDFLAAEFFDRCIRERAFSEEPISILFADGLGKRTIPQSTERALGWLATFNVRTKELISEIRPSLLLESGDPKALSLGDREVILRNQARLYENLRYRGEWFYHNDIKRFILPELSPVVSDLLDTFTSPELMDFLIESARFGGMHDLAPKLAEIITTRDTEFRTKAEACTALCELNDASFKGDVLTSALTAVAPDQTDTDAAPHWNMFQLRALQYAISDVGLLDVIAVLARVQRERSNYSSLTYQILVDICEGLDVESKLLWLAILLRFALNGRSENQYELPDISVRYRRFLPAIIYLASETIESRSINADDPILLDAIELAMGCEDSTEVFGRKAPTQKLAAVIRARPDIKQALIHRRLQLFQSAQLTRQVPFGVIHPLEFDDHEDKENFFTKEDVTFFCQEAANADGEDARMRALGIASDIMIKLRGNEHNKARETYLSHAKRFGDKNLRRQFGVYGFVARQKLRFQHQYRYEVRRWFRQQKNNATKVFTDYKNLRHFKRNRKRILSGDLSKEAVWLYSRDPNHLGVGTIEALRKEYGTTIAKMFDQGLREYWKVHATDYNKRDHYTSKIGLAGVNLDDACGEFPSGPQLARSAFQYSFAQLNSFPDWVQPLAANFPIEFCSEMKAALLVDFNLEKVEQEHYTSDCISRLAYSGAPTRCLIAPLVLRLMKSNAPRNRRDRAHCLDMIARSATTEINAVSRFLVAGFKHAWRGFDFCEAWVWLDALLNSNSKAGFNLLQQVFGELAYGGQKALFFEYLGREGNRLTLDGDRSDIRENRANDPQLLEWMVQCAYLACPPENDERHEEIFSPGKKDYAERNREGFLNSLVGLHSEQALEALMRLANNVDLRKYRDTFLYQSQVLLRGAGRRREFSAQDTIKFLNDQSKAPTTVEEFRTLCTEHIKALLTMLHCSDDDESAFFRRGKAREDDLRNWLSARLGAVGEHYYTVNREEEVAGGNRPDLRLHAKANDLGKVSVEIKLADMKHWTGDTLVETPDTQLASQYLLEPSSHSGIYVLVNASRPRKREINPKTKKTERAAFSKKVSGRMIDFEGLVKAVQIKCNDVNANLQGGKEVVLVARDISEKPKKR